MVICVHFFYPSTWETSDMLLVDTNKKQILVLPLRSYTSYSHGSHLCSTNRGVLCSRTLDISPRPPQCSRRVLVWRRGLAV